MPQCLPDHSAHVNTLGSAKRDAYQYGEKSGPPAEAAAPDLGRLHPLPGVPASKIQGIRASNPAKSTPAGRVPNATPDEEDSRLAQNASATAPGAYRTSSAPCSTTASRSTSHRARVSRLDVSVSSARSDDHAAASRRSACAAGRPSAA